MIAYASSLDCVGLMARRVGDVRRTLGEWVACLRCVLPGVGGLQHLL